MATQFGVALGITLPTKRRSRNRGWLSAPPEGDQTTFDAGSSDDIFSEVLAAEPSGRVRDRHAIPGDCHVLERTVA